MIFHNSVPLGSTEASFYHNQFCYGPQEEHGVSNEQKGLQTGPLNVTEEKTDAQATL